jgi:glycosyltransferase involved in cell wall biosynthesis
MAITELDVGGAEKALVRIARGLKSWGWHVQVISVRDAGPLTKELQEFGIPVLALGCGGLFDVRAVWRMKNALVRQKPDVLLTFLNQANLAGRIAGRWARVPKILSGIRVADRRWSVIIPERMTCGLVDHYVAVSHAVSQVHGSLCGIRAEQIAIIPNGVDLEAIVQSARTERESLQCGPDDFIILSVGRLSPQKAPMDLLSAFEKLKRGYQDPLRPLKLVFAGDGPLRSSLQKQIAASSLGDSVSLLGWRSDVWGVMKASDVLVLTSHWEGLPNVILEAQAAELPVIASAVDGCTELIADKHSGRLFSSGATEDLAQILAEVIARPQDAASMAATALAEVREKFTWDICVEQYHALLLRTGTQKS